MNTSTWLQVQWHFIKQWAEHLNIFTRLFEASSLSETVICNIDYCKNDNIKEVITLVCFHILKYHTLGMKNMCYARLGLHNTNFIPCFYL